MLEEGFLNVATYVREVAEQQSSLKFHFSVYIHNNKALPHPNPFLKKFRDSSGL